jgi:cleavage stimulation factor subunit 1
MYVASGSEDCSIKLLDVKKMHYFSIVKGEQSDDYTQGAAKPVVRTFYDHAQAINALDFHPIEPFLVSGSQDCTIKFFDFSKMNKKQAYRHIVDTHPIRSVSFHPSGDFLLAGTDHPMIRLYDVNTFQAYTCPEIKQHHLGPINEVRYAAKGDIYASASEDGCIKIWDGVTNMCVKSMQQAHGGEAVTSVQFSPSGQYLLSSGQDSTARLWELSTGKEVMAYAGATNEETPMRSVFDFSGDFVLSSTEDNNAVVAWDTRTGTIVKHLGGNNKPVRSTAASPTEDSFVTCGEDARMRFWSAKEA